MPGAAMVELVNNDRVIGGMDDASADRAQELYATFVKGRLYKTDLTTSEMVKVMENTYRDVNVALANEFAKLSETAGVNVWHAIELANHHPRVNILRPGPGVGGHCIAVDPWFLVQMDEANSHLIRSARQVNDAMPAYVVDRAVRMLSRSQAHVAVLGLSYRSDIGDTRESPALAVCHELRRRGIPFRAHDPLVTGGRTSVPNGSLEDAVTDAQLLLVVTDHTEFRNLDPNQIAPRMARRALLDARCCLPIERWRSAGFRAEVMGGFTARG
jgi:UDP-N-acetyl-D-mannosaminuronic acid dehydrogenase